MPFFITPSLSIGWSNLFWPWSIPPFQVITEALVAFTWLLKFPLPAVEQNADQLTKELFVLLKDYSKAGAARGENYHLVQNCFKVEMKFNCFFKEITRHLPPLDWINLIETFRLNCCIDLWLFILSGYLSGHHNTGEECEKQQNLRDTAAGAAGIRWGGHLRPVSSGHRLRPAEGDQSNVDLLVLCFISGGPIWRLNITLKKRCFCVPAGHSVQEARCSRDGGGVEKSSQAVRERQQRYDQNPLPTGTRARKKSYIYHLCRTLNVRNVLRATLSAFSSGFYNGNSLSAIKRGSDVGY